MTAASPDFSSGIHSYLRVYLPSMLNLVDAARFVGCNLLHKKSSTEASRLGLNLPSEARHSTSFSQRATAYEW
jgi:hypothetical protein